MNPWFTAFYFDSSKEKILFSLIIWVNNVYSHFRCRSQSTLDIRLQSTKKDATRYFFIAPVEETYCRIPHTKRKKLLFVWKSDIIWMISLHLLKLRLERGIIIVNQAYKGAWGIYYHTWGVLCNWCLKFKCRLCFEYSSVFWILRTLITFKIKDDCNIE